MSPTDMPSDSVQNVDDSGNKKFVHRSMGFSRLRRLAAKELLEILRDRRTVVTLVLMPLLVYPLLGTIVQKFMLSSLSNLQQVEYLIAAENEEELAVIDRFLVIGESILNPEGMQRNRGGSQPNGSLQNKPVEDLIRGQLEAPPLIRLVKSDPDKLDEYVMLGVFDVGVRITNREALKKNPNARETVQFELVQREDSALSAGAYEFVTQRLEAVNDKWVEDVLRQQGVNLSRPNAVRTLTLKSEDEEQPALLTFIPLMLVLMTMTGAVYPAIDLTAGERERGTMEILMAAPVSRMALLFGKFVAVLAVAMLTALINMAAMLVTVYTLGLDSIIFGEQGVSALVVLTIFALLLVFAAFFSAVLLSLTSFARSFKEAQAYLIPIMLVALAPALLSLFPDLEMDVTLALVPLVNIILLGRDLIAGQVNLTLVTITVVSTLLYGFLALGTASKIFGSDSVLFGGTSSWSDIFARPTEMSYIPSMPTTMLFLSVLFPCFIVIGGLATRFDISIQKRLVVNAGVTSFLFVGLPLIFCTIFNLRVRTANLLNPPRLLGVLVACLLGVSVWTFIYEIEVYSLSETRLEVLKDVFETMKVELQKIPLALKLVCLALIPAVCEEFTFRGFMMSAFLKHTKVWVAIMATAVMFGLFHVFVRDALLFERMLPSSLMGILLGIVCVRTGSVIPGMILHTIHNGLLISLAHFENELKEIGFGGAEQQHIPMFWLAAAILPILIGFALLSLKAVRSQNPTAEESETAGSAPYRVH
ncbi:MAG: ABC transporter permease subunit [Mariniblastus sp.]|nr:ABC transporter permease subunit [Mariniblastus sp.]